MKLAHLENKGLWFLVVIILLVMVNEKSEAKIGLTLGTLVAIGYVVYRQHAAV